MNIELPFAFNQVHKLSFLTISLFINLKKKGDQKN